MPTKKTKMPGAKKVDGRVFAMFGPKAVRHQTSEGSVDELVASGVGKHFDRGHGRLMREWVAVAQGGPDWLELAKEAYEFVKRGNS